MSNGHSRPNCQKTVFRRHEQRQGCVLSARCGQADPSEGNAGPAPNEGGNGCLDSYALEGSEDARPATGERPDYGDITRALWSTIVSGVAGRRALAIVAYALQAHDVISHGQRYADRRVAV